MIDVPTFVGFIAATAFFSVLAGMVIQAMLSANGRARAHEEGREAERQEHAQRQKRQVAA